MTSGLFDCTGRVTPVTLGNGGIGLSETKWLKAEIAGIEEKLAAR